ncbi:MAG TPA: NUDIX domain-containing protein, partial [Stellaceae bacterium]|nr:NUDIX domain-containing protein [Stellaceae bacterium]
KPERPWRHGVAFWLTRPDGAVLLRRRPERGLLGGMIEIPSTPWRERPWSLKEALAEAPAAVPWSPLPGTVQHGFTHFRLELAIVAGRSEAGDGFSGSPRDPVARGWGLWSPVERLGEHALPSLMKKLVRHAVSVLAPTDYAGAANSGGIASAARRTGAKERR